MIEPNTGPKAVTKSTDSGAISCLLSLASSPSVSSIGIHDGWTGNRDHCDIDGEGCRKRGESRFIACMAAARLLGFIPTSRRIVRQMRNELATATDTRGGRLLS